MKTNTLPALERLNELFEYCPDTGAMRWAKKTCRKIVVGAPVGSFTNGYLQTAFDGGRYLVHRIAWKMHYGTEPDELDHINGDRSDNRIKNLREVDRTQNNKNMALRSDNTSGHHGVSENKHGSYIAQIWVNKKYEYLGSYATKEEAIAARKAAEQRHGFHKNHGRGNRNKFA